MTLQQMINFVPILLNHHLCPIKIIIIPTETCLQVLIEYAIIHIMCITQGYDVDWITEVSDIDTIYETKNLCKGQSKYCFVFRTFWSHGNHIQEIKLKQTIKFACVKAVNMEAVKAVPRNASAKINRSAQIKETH